MTRKRWGLISHVLNKIALCQSFRNTAKESPPASVSGPWCVRCLVQALRLVDSLVPAEAPPARGLLSVRHSVWRILDDYSGELGPGRVGGWGKQHR